MIFGSSVRLSFYDLLLFLSSRGERWTRNLLLFFAAFTLHWVFYVSLPPSSSLFCLWICFLDGCCQRLLIFSIRLSTFIFGYAYISYPRRCRTPAKRAWRCRRQQLDESECGAIAEQQSSYMYSHICIHVWYLMHIKRGLFFLPSNVLVIGESQFIIGHFLFLRSRERDRGEQQQQQQGERAGHPRD